MTDIENSAKKTLKESAVTECGPMPDSAPMNPGNPVTMSVTLNASGKDHVNDLLMMMKAAGLDKAEVQPPSLPMRQDMDRLGAIMRDAEFDQEERDYSDPEPEYYDELPQSTGGINGPKKMFKPAAKGDNPMAVGEAGIDPDEVRSLQKINDLMQLKQQASALVKASQMKTDKKMSLLRNIIGSRDPKNIHGLLWNSILGKEKLHAIGSNWNSRHESEESDVKESIKTRLLQALSEKKAKPDFLDMDKDGNKKEPMKKAVADKKKVKEASKPDFLDMDKDGNKKEPMKKALKDKKKNPFKK